MAFKTVCYRIKLNNDINNYIILHELTSPSLPAIFRLNLVLFYQTLSINNILPHCDLLMQKLPI